MDEWIKKLAKRESGMRKVVNDPYKFWNHPMILDSLDKLNKAAARAVRKRARHIRRSQLGHNRNARDRRRQKKRRLLHLFLAGKLSIQKKLVLRKADTDRTKSVTLRFPANWSVKENPEEVFGFLQELDDAFFVTRARKVVVDHSALDNVTPEAVLVLIAECQRVTQYSPQTYFHGNFAGCKHEIMEVLDGMGYLGYYGLKDRLHSSNGRIFLEHTAGHQTDPVAAAGLVRAFHLEGGLPIARCRRLGTGLIECMQNVSHHAYVGAKGRKIMGWWWMLGYLDKVTNELYFAFYDQGVGMPSRLRFKMRDKTLLIQRSGSELMLAAFQGAFSSTGLRNRGLGLPRLKRLVDEAVSGEFFVHSKKSRVALRPKQKPAMSETKRSLEGTLLVWQVRV
jgi:hypothetical protein